jgi:hypothetical protein
MPHALISPTPCLAEPGADLDPVRACLAPDLGPPGLDVVHLLDRVDHRAARQQLAVVVAAVDTRDDAVDASPDANGIVHDLPEIIMRDRGSECPVDREAAWRRRCQRRQQRGSTAAYGAAMLPIADGVPAFEGPAPT